MTEDPTEWATEWVTAEPTKTASLLKPSRLVVWSSVLLLWGVPMAFGHLTPALVPSQYSDACSQMLKPVFGLPPLPTAVDLETAIPTIPGIRDAVAVVVHRADHRLWLGLRQGSTGAGTWGFLGGKRDENETLAQTAYREVSEEAGPDFKIGSLELITSVYDYRADQKQLYRVFIVAAEHLQGLPRLVDPRTVRILAFDPHALPTPLFEPVQGYLPQVLKFYDPSFTRSLTGSSAAK